jgi:galactokinase
MEKLLTPNGQFKDYLSKLFYEQFHEDCAVVVAAPGRVNLIGEHTDYNEGLVLPMALDREVYVALRPRNDRKLRLYSFDYRSGVELDLGSLKFRKEGSWDNYVAAVYWALQQEGYHVGGADLLMLGNLPQGTGLSSSAAVELAVARGACALGAWAWDAPAMALLAQKAENQFVGVNCGIMDQFAVAVAEPHSALFLDCRNLATRSLPIRFKDAEFVVINSGVKRELQSSQYNTRRSECEEAVSKLGALKPGLKSLRDADLALLKKAGQDSAVWAKRARHVITENTRVEDAVKALEKADAPAFGTLMNASHESLRHDYQVSCEELDVLVEAAREQESCLGSRLTGAGFGGCTISLVKRSGVENFEKRVAEIYRQTKGKSPQTFVFKPGLAARVL